MNRRKALHFICYVCISSSMDCIFLCAPYIAPFDPETTSVADRLQDIAVLIY